MKITVTAPEIGPKQITRVTIRTIGGGLEERIEEHPPVTPNGQDFHDVFVTPEGPVSPENALDALLAGRATLVTSIDEANATVHHFAGRAMLDVAQQVRYQRVIDAASWVQAREREARAWRLIGLDVDAEDFIPPTGDRAYFTAVELADIFGVDVATIEKWSGQELPAALRSKSGGSLFKVSAVITMLRNAGPAHPPARPPQDPRPVTPKRRQKVT